MGKKINYSLSVDFVIKRSEIRFQGHVIKEMIEKIYKRKQGYYETSS